MNTTDEHDEITDSNVEEDAQRDRKPGGAEGGESDAADAVPAAPADDSLPAGDTDQHSWGGA